MERKREITRLHQYEKLIKSHYEEVQHFLHIHKWRKIKKQIVNEKLFVRTMLIITNNKEKVKVRS